MSKEQLKELKRFNENIEWLKKNHSYSVSYKNTEKATEWVYLPVAESILNRGMTWIKTRMLEAHEANPPINTNWFLIRGLDWEKEGKLLIFNKNSVMRLKSEMIRMGANPSYVELSD